MKHLHNRFHHILLVYLLFILVFPASPAAAKSPVTFESLYSFESVGDVQLSPGGSRLTFVSRRSVVETNSSLSTVWLMDVSGKMMKKISPGGKSAWHPRWVDQGKRIAFLTVTDQGAQVFTCEIDTGKIEQVTHYASGVNDYVWSPTGEGLAFVTGVYPENNSLEYYLQKKEMEKSVKHSGKLYDKLLFRPYSRWDDGTITHILYQRFSDPEITDVTPGTHNAPTSHLGGSQDIAFSADGKTIAFTMNTDPVKAVSTNNDVFTADLSGKNRVRISPGKGCDVDPRFSPDGRYMFYIQMARPQYEADQKDIILIDLKSGKRTNLTERFDRTLSETSWSPDSRYIYFTCGDKGFRAMYRIDIASGKMEKLLGDVYFSSVNVDREGKTIYMIKTPMDRPGEIFRYDLKRKTFTQLTFFSDEFVKNHDLATTETFRYKGAGNDPVMGFISFPPGYDRTKKYPMLMLIHGGPEGAWSGNYTNYGWNVHLMVAHGYISVKINPHGSSSYGLAFQEAILGNWGIVDYEDFMKGLDYVLKTYPAIDERNVAALGRSYGGFMVNFLNGSTDRFNCFISIDGIFDQAMGYYATDELWFMEMEFKGTPVTSPEIYKRSSPMTYAENFKTPTLVIHGGRDYRVDLSQGIGMFTALQRNGVPSQLLYFPDEPHYYRKLQTWKYVYEVQLKWLHRWLKKP